MASIRVMVAAAMLSIAGPAAAGAKEIVIAIPGVPGPYCAYGAEKRLLELDGVERVAISWTDEKILISTSETSRLTLDDIKQAIKRAEYPYKFEVRMDGE